VLSCRDADDEPEQPLEDTLLRLYDTDGETVLDENDDELVGKESLIHWKCPKSGCARSSASRYIHTAAPLVC
jgi:hypothetical protein